MGAESQVGHAARVAGDGGRTTLVLVVAALFLFVMFLGCGVVGAAFFWFYSRAEARNWQDPLPVRLPGMTAQPSVNDWMTARTLAPAYTTALDAVALDEKVKERLGDAIEPVQPEDGSAELFRREDSGQVDSEGEALTFDVQGQKGTAVVSVVVDTGAAGATQNLYRVSKISVKLQDGTVLDVPPPQNQPAFAPIR